MSKEGEQIAVNNEPSSEVPASGPNQGHYFRDRWAGRITFILAAVGAAVGLGNFWRFPKQSYKNGGAVFFIPYLLALFFFGMPLLVLELSLGQKFQRGDIGVFRGIHPRLAGIGIASIWSGYIIVIYYVPIIAYAMFYFGLSFTSPIPWSDEGIASIRKCPNMAPAAEFFYVHALKVTREDTCENRTPGDTEGIAWWIFFCNTLAWIICFICVMRGVKTASYIVWVSVPLPLILIVIMIIRGNSLDGSENGIDLYL